MLNTNPDWDSLCEIKIGSDTDSACTEGAFGHEGDCILVELAARIIDNHFDKTFRWIDKHTKVTRLDDVLQNKLETTCADINLVATYRKSRSFHTKLDRQELKGISTLKQQATMEEMESVAKRRARGLAR